MQNALCRLPLTTISGDLANPNLLERELPVLPWATCSLAVDLSFGSPEDTSSRPRGPCTRKFITSELMDPLRKRAHEKTYL